MTSKLIELAKGNRSVREYARESGVSAAYISGLIKGKYIPSLKILSKLSKVSHNGVTYEQLVTSINTKTN